MEAKKAKFNFYERVKIYPKVKNAQHLYDTTGTVLGRSQNYDNSWGYAVSCDKDLDGWDFQENELQSLGTFAKREDYYSGESIRVGVTKEGEGYIIDDKNDTK